MDNTSSNIKASPELNHHEMVIIQHEKEPGNIEGHRERERERESEVKTEFYFQLLEREIRRWRIQNPI